MSINKLKVCPNFIDNLCSLSTCFFAHPGVRDSCKVLFRTKKKDNKNNHFSNNNNNKSTYEERIPYVIICPNANGILNDCPLGKKCTKYHVYVRPTTLEIIRNIYPVVKGLKSKTFANGAKLTGNVNYTVLSGYGIMKWPNGSTYLGDWFENKRHGFGVYRLEDGTEYVGCFKNGKRHGWGCLVNVLNEEYIGYKVFIIIISLIIFVAVVITFFLGMYVYKIK
jgi:hypothetical protein